MVLFDIRDKMFFYIILIDNKINSDFKFGVINNEKAGSMATITYWLKHNTIKQQKDITQDIAIYWPNKKHIKHFFNDNLIKLL